MKANRRRIAGESAPGPRATAVAEPARKPRAEKLVVPRSAPASPPKEPRAPRRGLVRFVPWLVLSLGLALLVAGGVRWFSHEEIDRSGAVGAATSATETIFSFTSETLDDHESAAKSLMTDNFVGEFDKIAPTLAEIAPQREFEVEARVQEAGVVPCGDECSADEVTVLVFFDQVRLIAGVDDPTVLDNRAEVTLVRDGESWLVDDIRAI